MASPSQYKVTDSQLREWRKQFSQSKEFLPALIEQHSGTLSPSYIARLLLNEQRHDPNYVPPPWGTRRGNPIFKKLLPPTSKRTYGKFLTHKQIVYIDIPEPSKCQTCARMSQCGSR